MEVFPIWLHSPLQKNLHYGVLLSEKCLHAKVAKYVACIATTSVHLYTFLCTVYFFFSLFVSTGCGAIGMCPRAVDWHRPNNLNKIFVRKSHQFVIHLFDVVSSLSYMKLCELVLFPYEKARVVSFFEHDQIQRKGSLTDPNLTEASCNLHSIHISDAAF